LERIRIVLAGLQPLLHDILRGIVSGEADMAVVGEADEPDALPLLVRGVLPDVVIMGLAGEEVPQICEELVHRHPSMKVLGIGPDARHAWLYEIRPHREVIGKVSHEALLHAIRVSARAGR
jgi:DNA-binding NarL/FixJ family response regulator